MTVEGRFYLASAAKEFLDHVMPFRTVGELAALPRSLDEAKAQLTSMLRADRSGTHPLRHLVMVDWLFGSSANLLSRTEARDLSGRRRASDACQLTEIRDACASQGAEVIALIGAGQMPMQGASRSRGYAYNAFDRIESTEAVGMLEQRVTRFRYDRAGRLTHRIGSAYEAFDAVTQQTRSVTPVELTRYDALGRIVESVSRVNKGEGDYVYFYESKDGSTTVAKGIGTLRVNKDGSLKVVPGKADIQPLIVRITPDVPGSNSIKLELNGVVSGPHALSNGSFDYTFPANTPLPGSWICKFTSYKGPNGTGGLPVECRERPEAVQA